MPRRWESVFLTHGGDFGADVLLEPTTDRRVHLISTARIAQPLKSTLAPTTNPIPKHRQYPRRLTRTSCACAGLAVRPVPMAQTGSYATATRAQSP